MRVCTACVSVQHAYFSCTRMRVSRDARDTPPRVQHFNFFYKLEKQIKKEHVICIKQKHKQKQKNNRIKKKFFSGCDLQQAGGQ